MKVRRIVDVCDGDYTMIEEEIQDTCIKCGSDILHKPSWGKEGKKVCIDCICKEDLEELDML